MKTINSRVLTVFVAVCLFLTAGFTQNALAGLNAGPPFKIFVPLIQKPVDSSKGVLILPGTTTFMDNYDYLHIVGEVANFTRSTVWYIRVTANLYDSSNRLIDSVYVNTNLTTLPANGKTCFHVSIYAPSGWKYYSFDPPDFETTGPSIPALVLLSDDGTYDPESGDYHITGQVWNNSTQTVNYVSAVGTLYNSAGSVIGCDYAFIQNNNNNTSLGPYQPGTFDIGFFQRNHSDVSTYRTQLDGQIQ